ncbi:DegT/DnrJ/EryC1/StrS family aminotransferase [Pontibacter qinzhouensis]|uniref:DegT/DnrJ/EryC1/StrS family aminotransferase n=1 Tax=Pontibacter qinzhouensis TaxID=2603253 RepID=A0A5C8K980_9BACT|nr:DegT/DnrJ/EryC1/StrS family aminotransferase [Pontibacter qinzhouensis]TXK47126.1 DegT/DnrJ/EryC1/StrS family aminotransferase [Pontibacter qinzhouensis]
MAAIPYFEFRDFPEGVAAEVEHAVLQAVRSKRYILSEQVTAFEQAFATTLGAAHAIGVGNGYDALVLALKAIGAGPGDEVIVPANTFIATANAVVQAGCVPVLVEPDLQTYNLAAAVAERAITARTKAIMPVHLYGQACEMNALVELAAKHHLHLIEDFAQAQGATFAGKAVGTFGTVNATSFYPTKNLGALGDGGAVVTNDAAIAAFVHSYHNYGETTKYRNDLVGINSRLDVLQAAVLEVKLKFLTQANAERQRQAQFYLQELEGVGNVVLPFTAPGSSHVFHVFNIRSSHRDALKAHLQEQGIATAIHYPVPVHLQTAYSHLGYKPGDLPIAEELASTSLSLPLFPGLRQEEQQLVVKAVKKFFR